VLTPRAKIGRMPAPGSLPPTLLAAVGDAIKEHGVSALSLRDVARRAGVSHGAPAHHFQNKSGLLTAFATQGYEQLAEVIGGELAHAAPRDGPATLEAVGRGYVRFALDHPEHFETMFRLDALDLSNDDFNRASEAAYAVLVDTIARCRDEGHLPARETELVTVAAWSIVHGLSALLISGRLADRIRETKPERLAARISKLFVDRVLTGTSR
jgi:AcrR family transcriptional regulator